MTPDWYDRKNPWRAEWDDPSTSDGRRRWRFATREGAEKKAALVASRGATGVVVYKFVPPRLRDAAEPELPIAPEEAQSPPEQLPRNRLMSTEELAEYLSIRRGRGAVARLSTG